MVDSPNPTEGGRSRAAVDKSIMLLIPYFLLLLVGTIAIADYFVYPLVVRPRLEDFNKGDNGLWMGSRWYLGKATDQELTAMSERLNKAQVRYAYFHVRDINRAGSLRHHCQAEAVRLVQFLHDHCPQVKVLAWVGAVASRSGGEVDLAFDHVRKRMVNEAQWLTNVCGFDGVQWDYEICLDGDAGFIKLVEATRAKLAPGKVLSVAAPMRWSSKYYSLITKNCDQIAVMCYDSVCFLPRLYVDVVAQEAARVTNLVAGINPDCRVVLGVPTYEDRTIAHNIYAENLMMALVGVKQGLSDSRARLSVFAGIAPYADFTTDDSKWRIYQKYWLCD